MGYTLSGRIRDNSGYRALHPLIPSLALLLEGILRTAKQMIVNRQRLRDMQKCRLAQG